MVRPWLGWIALFFSSTLFTGFLPGKLIGKPGKGGGMAGALVGVGLQCLFLYYHAPWWVSVVAVALAFLVGLLTVGAAERFMLQRWGPGVRHTGAVVTEDRNETNIDEVMGQLIAGFGVTIAPPADLFTTYASLSLCFACFRLWDSLKWWPVAAVEKRFHGSAFGVMFDDAIAGIPGLLVWYIALR